MSVKGLSGPETAAPLRAADDTGAFLDGLPAPLRLWARPITNELSVAAATKDKPLGELTMPELAAWMIVGCWCLATGIVIGHVGANLAVAALRGPYRR